MKLNFRIIFRRLCQLLVPLWISACASTDNISSSTNQESNEINNSRIVFLNYAFWKDQSETYHIELINKIVADGQMKDHSDHHSDHRSDGREGDLKCLTLDEKMKPVSSVIVPDPLIKRGEYEQENGTLTSKLVELDSTVFSVRMPLEAGSRYIAVERINPSDSSFLYVTEIQ